MTVPASGPAVRGERWLVRVDNAIAWLDGWMARRLPGGSDPLTQAGRMANLALLWALASGVLLLIWYSSSLYQAYDSLEALRGRTLGGWVRAVHRYSSDLVMLFLAVHALRMFFARKFTGARWLPWVSGVSMTAVIWLIGWTGYWLVWDQPAQNIAITSMGFLDALPVFGEPLSRLFLTDRLVPSPLFFVVFFLHMLLPLLIALGLAVHLIRLNRVRLLPDRRLSLAFGLALGLASWLVPAPLDDPARMAVKATHLTVDAWYLTPLALALRLQAGGLWLALGGVGLLGAGVPWLLGRRFKPRPDPAGMRPPADFQTVVETARCHACTQCVQDCPFDAVRMVPRTDGSRFELQAWVDPSRCVGCAVCVGSCDSEAMHLPWFDAMKEEPRIQTEVTEAVGRTGTVRVALVAADATGGAGHFDETAWRHVLPAYQVHGVPTAAWVRPKFVERLLAGGVARVLIVRDARTESAARDGNQWAQARLAGERKPAFRPARAGAAGGAWQVMDFNASDPERLRAEAAAFANGADDTVAERPSGWTGPRMVSLAAALTLLMGVTVAPSHLQVANPQSPVPELVFSFKAFGDREAATLVDAAAEANRPVHMRGAPVGKPRRDPVRVRLIVNGVSEERTYRAKGVSRDGPAIDIWRQVLPTGRNDVVIEVFTGGQGEPLRWTGALDAEPRRLHVVTYDPAEGFRLE